MSFKIDFTFAMPKKMRKNLHTKNKNFVIKFKKEKQNSTGMWR